MIFPLLHHQTEGLHEDPIPRRFHFPHSDSRLRPRCDAPHKLVIPCRTTAGVVPRPNRWLRTVASDAIHSTSSPRQAADFPRHAKVTLLTGTEKQEVELKPAGDKLEATGSFKVRAGTKAVAVVTVAGKPATARFTLK